MKFCDFMYLSGRLVSTEALSKDKVIELVSKYLEKVWRLKVRSIETVVFFPLNLRHTIRCKNYTSVAYVDVYSSMQSRGLIVCH